VSKPTREGKLLDLLFANREGLAGDVMVGGCLGQSYHEMTEFSFLREVRRRVSITAILDCRREDFGLFRCLVDRVLWEAALKGGPKSSGRLDNLQEGSLKDAGAGHPHVLKDKLVGKKTGLAEQRAMAGTQEKKESLCPLEEVEGNSGGLQGCCEVTE